MSTRRARIKPAINLAASRRSAGSKPGPTKPSAKPKQRAPQAETVEKTVPKKPPDKNVGAVPSKEPELPAVAEQSDVKRAGAESANVCPVNETTGEGKTIAIENKDATVASQQAAADSAREDGDVLESPYCQMDQPSKEEPTSNIDPRTDRVTAGSQVTAAENEKETKSTESSANKNPVRRKRISAIPNVNKRRLPGGVASKGPAAAKRRPIPKVGQPSVEHSKIQQPKVVTPKDGEPKNDAPTVDQPVRDKPVVDQPVPDRPEGMQPEVGHPQLNSNEVPEAGAPQIDDQRITGISSTADSDDPSLDDTQGNLGEKPTGDVGMDDIITDEVEVDLGNEGEKGSKPVEPPAIQRKIFSQPLQKFNQTNENDALATRKKLQILKNNIYKKKLEEMKSIKKEETASHRRRRYAYCVKDGVDPSKMLMRDLIYFNPKENRMSSKNDSPVDKNSVSTRQSIPRSDDEEEDPDESEEASFSQAPQITIGPDGNIILDKQSLVKVVTPKRKLDESEITEVKEDSSTTTYSSFRKPTYSATWSEKDTAKFYHALSAVGTDFSMINAIFPNRRRRELKNKFKREERKNAERMERTLKDIRTFDFCDFQNMDEEEKAEEEKAGDKAFKKPGRKRKKKHANDPQGPYIAPRSRKSSTGDETPQTDAEETTPSSVASETSTLVDEEVTASSKKALQALQNPFGLKEGSKDRADQEGSDEEENYDMGSILGKPTRSGRQPKQREVFTIEESPVRPSGDSGSGKRKVAKDRGKKRKRKNIEATGLSSTESAVSGTIGTNRVPPLHPDGRQAAYNPLQGPPISITTNQSVVTQRNPPVRTEHYMITYPDGRRTLIQMPVPLNADKNFDFVFNVLPSPVRQGGVLQLQAVPRTGGGGVTQNESVALSVNPNNPNNPNVAASMHAPSRTSSASDATRNLASSSNVLLSQLVKPSPGVSNCSTPNPSSPDVTSTMQEYSHSPPVLVHSPSPTNQMGLASVGGDGHAQETIGLAPSQSNSGGLPMKQGSSFTLNSSGRSLVLNHPSGSSSPLTSGSRTTPNTSHVIPPLVPCTNRTEKSHGSGNQKMPLQGGSHDHHHSGPRVPHVGSSPFRVPPSGHLPRQKFHGLSNPPLSKQALSAITDPPSCLQKSHSRPVMPSPLLGVNTSSHFNPGSDPGRFLLSPQQKGQTLPPVSTLLNRSPYQLDMMVSSPDRSLATTGQSPQGLGVNNSCNSPLLDPGITSAMNDPVCLETRGLDLPLGVSVEVGSSPLGTREGSLGMGDREVFVPDLADPMSEASDLILGHQVDVSSSVPHDDFMVVESEEAFVPGNS